MNLRILSAADVRQALPMAEAIAAMKQAFAQLSAGRADVPLRGRVTLPGGITLVMPAYLADTNDLGVKIVSVFPQNVKRGRPVINAVAIALDSETGEPLALLEGGALTAIRTAAGSGAATDLLARPDAAVVAIIGSGVQARAHLEAVCAVRPIREARVYSPNLEHAHRFAADMAGLGPAPAAIHVAANPAEAVRGADIICAATSSSTPVFDGRDLQPGAHVNAIGSFTPQMQEVDVETVRRSLVVVDSRTAALEEAGDLIIPLRAGIIDESHIHAELGELVNGTKPGRTSPDQITFFKSVGIAVQDTAAAAVALRNATAYNLGTIVTL